MLSTHFWLVFGRATLRWFWKKAELGATVVVKMVARNNLGCCEGVVDHVRASSGRSFLSQYHRVVNLAPCGIDS